MYTTMSKFSSKKYFFAMDLHACVHKYDKPGVICFANERGETQL